MADIILNVEVRERTGTGSLTLHAWYFHMPSGQLFRFDRDRNGFFRLDNNLLHPTGDQE